MSAEAGGDIDLRSTPSIIFVNFMLQELKSPSLKSAELFAEFKCSDDTRHIHQLVMRSELPDPAQNGRRIPVPAAIFDHVAEYLHRGKLTSVEDEKIISVFKAANSRVRSFPAGSSSL